MPEATGPVFDDLDDAIESLGNGVGHAGADECEHGILVASDGMDERAQRLQTAKQCAFGPLLEEALRGPGCSISPEVLELFFQAPCAVDSSVVLVERFEASSIAPASIRRMAVEQPPQPFECLAVVPCGFPPLFFAN